MKRKGLLAASLALTLSVVGCSGKGENGEPTPTPVTSQSVSVTPIPTPPDLGPNVQGVVKDVEITECPTNEGNVVAKGTAKNSAAEVRDIAIMVFWLTNDSGNPLGAGLVTLEDVAPGETVDWQVEAEVFAQADRCVLNVTSGELAEK